MVAPAYAATPEYNSTYWNKPENHAAAFFKVKGTTSMYGAPSAENAYTNPPSSAPMPSPTYVAAIGKNADGDYYYHLQNGYYVPAWKVTPEYGHDFIPSILDSNDSSSTVDCVFDTTYKLHGTIINKGGDVVTLDSVDVTLDGTTKSADVGSKGNYEIKAGSAISKLVDFSKLSIGDSHTLTVTAHFTNHWTPNGRNAIKSESFTSFWTKTFVLKQGAESTLSVSGHGSGTPSGSLTKGEKFYLRGVISSNYTITSVEAHIYNLSGNDALKAYKKSWNSTSYNIKNDGLDSSFGFGSLDVGSYRYVVKATDASGTTKTLIDSQFNIVEPTYTITYFYSMGEDWGSIFKEQPKAYNSTVYITDEVPTRQYETFIGWDTAKTAKNIVYHAGDAYAENKNLNLYAVWQPKTYTMTYETMGGTAVTPTTTSGDTPFVITATIPQRNGYRFIGWAESTGAITQLNPLYQPGDTFPFTGNDRTLCAHWEVSSYYTVVFDPNGGEGSARTVSKPHDTDVGWDIKFQKSGAAFVGWAYSPNATEQDVIGDRYRENADATLYAVWREGVVVFNYYMLSYSSSEGMWYGYIKSDANVDVLSTTGPFGTKCRPWADVVGPSGRGYLGTYSISTTDIGKPLSEVIWHKGEYGTGEIVDPWKYTYYREYALSNPDLIGYYTYLRENPTLADAVELTPDFIVDRSLTIYPFWSFDSNAVVYYANIPDKGLNVWTGSYSDIIVDKGRGEPDGMLKYKGATVVISNQIPVRDGYDFIGWATSRDATTPEYQPGDQYSADADLLLYAVWREAQHVPEGALDQAQGDSGSIVLAGWAFDRDDVNAQIPLHVYVGGPAGSGASVYQITANKERTDVGAAFSGVGNYHGFYEIINVAERGEQTVYVYAIDAAGQWRDNPLIGKATITISPVSYLVHYDANGDGLIPSDQTKTERTNLTLSDYIPKRPGYTFLGWGTSADAAQTSYQPGDVYTQDKDITLYAMWQLRRYEDSLTLPTALKMIEREAFEGLPIQEVVLPVGLNSIGSRAFANCGSLRLIIFSSASVDIDDEAFEDCEDYFFYAPPGGSVQTYAERRNIPFIAK